MIYESQNYGFYEVGGAFVQVAPPTPSDGDSFIGCNLSQYEDRPMFVGVNNLSFIDCNLINCDLPANAETDRCNTAKIVYEIVEVAE